MNPSGFADWALILINVITLLCNASLHILSEQPKEKLKYFWMVICNMIGITLLYCAGTWA